MREIVQNNSPRWLETVGRGKYRHTVSSQRGELFCTISRLKSSQYLFYITHKNIPLILCFVTWHGVWAPARLNCRTEVFYDLYHTNRKDNQATQSFISHLCWWHSDFYQLHTIGFIIYSVFIVCTWIMHKRYQQMDDRKYVETELW